MSDVADYETDILLWSERQAAVLRDLKARARNLPNELDLENVAEEIESVGRSELAAVESHLRLIMVHALKAASNPEEKLVAKWRSEASGFNSGLARRLTAAMARRIDLDDLWADAVHLAGLDLASHSEPLVSGLPTAAPIGLAVLTAKPLDFDGIVARIHAARLERSQTP